MKLSEALKLLPCASPKAWRAFLGLTWPEYFLLRLGICELDPDQALPVVLASREKDLRGLLLSAVLWSLELDRPGYLACGIRMLRQSARARLIARRLPCFMELNWRFRLNILVNRHMEVLDGSC